MHASDKLEPAREQEWVKKAQADASDFTPLYEHYVPKIYRYLRFKTNNDSLAEDLTAQTFCEALENIGKFRWQGTSFGAWLYRIAHNLLVDHVRAHNRREPLNENEDYDANQDIESEVNEQWSLEKVYEALRTLPEIAQQVVSLRVMEDLSHREIAVIVGKTETNVKVIYSRAIAQLKARIVFVLAIAVMYITLNKW